MHTKDETCLYWYLAWVANGFRSKIRMPWADAKANTYVNPGTTFALVSVASLDGRVLFEVEDDPYRDDEVVEISIDAKALARGHESLDPALRAELDKIVSPGA